MLASLLCFSSISVGESKTIISSFVPFTIGGAIKLMEKLGIVHADIVMAQAKLETGNFTSKVFKENHNLFGMKLPKSRSTNALGEKNDHAYYISWVHSIRDYKLWQDRVVAKYKTRRAYLKYLSENYAEDKKYIYKLKQML